MNDREPAIKRRYCRRRISFMTSIYDRRITWQQLYSSMDRHFVLSNCRGAIERGERAITIDTAKRITSTLGLTIGKFFTVFSE
jgi:hypothetical protein